MAQMTAEPSADQVVSAALEQGQRDGLDTLDNLSRWIFLVSEAELLCDMEGVDSFVDRYGGLVLLELADAYRNLGAQALAEASRAVADALPIRTKSDLDHLNRLVCDRAGYDFKAIRAEVSRQLATRCPS
jgi:hypothetical protein